jgi:hypothetical protein
MCTLSFVPEKNGYVAAMNRDERLSRPQAFPPRWSQHAARRAVFPYEIGGGTWIAANRSGITLALLNWNSVEVFREKQHSRGVVIPSLIGRNSLAAVQAQIESLDLTGILPFRLVGIFPKEHALREWKWDQLLLQRQNYKWQRRHWFSSSASDITATKKRGAVCREFEHTSVGNIKEIRELHRSHENGPGPFSICAHRPGIETVSYSEVLWSRGELSFCYRPGPPCSKPSRHTVDFHRQKSQIIAEL